MLHKISDSLTAPVVIAAIVGGVIGFAGSVGLHFITRPPPLGPDGEVDHRQEALLALGVACDTGDVGACEDLYDISPLGSTYEAFALSRLAQGSTVSDAAVKAYERRLREQLRPGAIVYTTPDRMRIGQPVSVTARITRDELHTLPDSIYEGFDLAGEVQVEESNLAVGTRMRASLEGQHFVVSLIGPEEQFMRPILYREWEWQVEATRTGTWPLYLTVYATYEGEDIHYEVFKREVVVRVDPVEAIQRFANRNWQWLLVFLFGSGTGSALLGWWRRRTGRGGEGEPSADLTGASLAPGSIAEAVTDADDGQPVGGANVTADDTQVVTNGDRRYQIEE
jgi:hypothetical protein